MKQSLILRSLSLMLTLGLLQHTPACFGQGDLLYEGGANGTFSNTADWANGINPVFEFGGAQVTMDSLTFGATPAGGATVDNDLDPANNTLAPGTPYRAGLGWDAATMTQGNGTRDDSASFHFLDGSGDFTLTGFPIQVTSPSNAQLSAVRIEPTAGTLQTINNDIVLSRNAAARIIQLNSGNGGKLVLNGDIDFGPASTGSLLFGDNNLDSPVNIELNGVGTLNGVGGGPSQAWASGAAVNFAGNARRQAIRVNAGDLQRATIEGSNGSHIIFGNSQALGRAHSGSWDNNDLDYILIGSVRVERFNDGYADKNSFGVQDGISLAEYGINTTFGANWNFRSEHDTTIGFVSQVWAREDLNANNDNYPNTLHPSGLYSRDIQPNGSLTVDGEGALTVAAHGGIFPTHYDGAEQFDLRLPGTSGEVAGANGQMVVNGRLFNSWLSPDAQANFGTTSTGGIEPGPKVGVGDANVSLFAKPGQLVAEDGSLTNGSITVSYGTLTLNGDSGSTWKGSQFRAMNGSTVVIGHDNALGDAGSLVSIEDDSIVDTGTNTVAQKFINTNGTIRGNGTLTNEADWSIAGTVQPGGETPAASDTLTFDFSGASAANTLTFESSSAADFVLDAGTSSSTIDVLGSTVAGMTDVVFSDNMTFDFTDLTGGSLAAGDYTLVDGDANAALSLGSGITLTGLDAYSGSSLGIVGDDLVLSLVSGGIPGDFDNDGDVDIVDFGTFGQNFGLTGQPTDPPVDGDFDGDGDVDIVDFGTFGQNFGTGTGSGAAVPEPTSIVLLAMFAVGLFVRRRS